MSTKLKWVESRFIDYWKCLLSGLGIASLLVLAIIPTVLTIPLIPFYFVGKWDSFIKRDEDDSQSRTKMLMEIGGITLFIIFFVLVVIKSIQFVS